ncbi:hypothetical protein B566_EDAN001221 [Ephemera danica]|nr:hypothetical protein B566_EDAN001221 [Ephemera danica]
MNTPQETANNSAPFMSMNSLFGESGGQEQTTSGEQQAFSFGTFSFGASSSSAATNLFGSSSLFGSPTSQSAQNNLFGTSPSTPQSSEAFNLNFDKTNTPSIFKLF